jgi:hypothetical protein
LTLCFDFAADFVAAAFLSREPSSGRFEGQAGAVAWGLPGAVAFDFLSSGAALIPELHPIPFRMISTLHNRQEEDEWQ